jgi:calcineurin-like phosphoesterase family protein
MKFILFHYPIQSWNGAFRGAIHLHGHSHGHVKSENIKRMDVGVDCCNYKPINLDEIMLKMKEQHMNFVEDNLP